MTVGGFPAPRRVFGVHLDVGTDGGRRTWICRAHPGDDGVRVESADRLIDLPGGDETFEGASRALVAKILDAPRSVWGLDFGFALPIAAHDGAAPRPPGDGVADPVAAAWRAGLDRLLEIAEPDDLVGACDPDALAAWSRCGQRSASGERYTEFERARRGISAVVAPMGARPGVVVLPMDLLPLVPAGAPAAMAARAASIFVLEVAPRRRLASGDESGPAGELRADVDRAIDSPEERSEALETLQADGLVRPMQRALRVRIAESRGALLATAAAACAWNGFRSVDHASVRRDPRLPVLGYAYA